MIAACSSARMESHWQSQPISVDGNGSDWGDLALDYNEEMDIVYGAANNSENLLLTLRFRDARLAQKATHRGLVFWVNGDGKKKKSLGIRYVDQNAIPMRFEEMRERMGDLPPNDNWRDNRDERANRQLPMNGKFYRISGDTTEISGNGLNGFAGAVAFNDGVYCYEIKFPLSAIGEKAQPGQKIKIGLEVEAVSKEIREEMKERMKEMRGSRPGGGMGGGPPGGGMGGRPGGGRMGGRPGGMAGENPMDELDAQQLWVTLQLATENGG